MRALSILKTSLDLWLRRNHENVTFACIFVMVVTMFLEIGSSYFLRDLAFLLVAVGLTLPCQIVFQLAVRYLQLNWIDVIIDKMRRQRFADFIVRRLLHQLELASRRLPKPGTAIDLTDPATQQRFEQVQATAYEAVHLFRRDANVVLDQQPSERRQASRYIVLEEEEQALCRDGYASLHLLVTNGLLQQLLSPFGESPSSS